MNDEKLRLIGNAPFFSELTDEERGRIAQRMHLEVRRKGETLFQKNTASDNLYLVKSGWVRLVANGGMAIASQGPGSLVGETDLFLDRPRSHGAVIATDAELWVLDREDLVELLAESPPIGLKLSLAFGSRLALFDQYLLKNRLRLLPFFSGLKDGTLLAIAHHLVLVEKKKGEFVIESGECPQGLFIIESGQLYLHSSEEGGDFAELGEGESFGEMATLTGKPCARSVQAATDAVLWVLPADDFEALAEQYPEIRLALSKAIREPLLAQDQERAVARLGTMPLFEGLSEEVLWAVSGRLLLRHVPAGEFIFVEGAPGDALYLIDSGQVEIVADARTARAVLARLGADEFFGEMALLTGRPHSIAARAATHTNLWVLYRSDFDDLVNRYPSISLALSRVLSQRLAEMDRRFVESHLRGLKLLAGLSSGQLEDISRRLKPVRFRQGETIVREGDPGDEMFFIESGQVQVVRGSGLRAVILAELGSGDLFGEMALLTGNPRSATVTALSDVDLWVMSRADFDDLVTAYPNLALALSRVLSERLRHTDERFLRQPAPAPVVPAPPSPPVRRTARAVPVPQPVPRAVPQPRPVPAKARPVRAKPRRDLLAELKQGFTGLATWYGSLSRGAKVRLILVTMLLVWLICIAAPALVLSTLTAADVTSLRGAIAFVQVETTIPSPTEPPAPESTDLPVAASSPTSLPEAEEAMLMEALAAPAVNPTETPVQPSALPLLATPVSQQPTATPTPWIIVVTDTPLPPTDTPLPPTDTPVPARSPVTNRAASLAASQPAAPAPAEKPEPPRELDPRLSALGVVIEPANVKPGQKYWRLVKARWQNEQEAGNDHTIYIDVLDENGNRPIGEVVEVRWQGGFVPIITENKPPNEYPANFPMYNCLGSYSVRVAGLPSDIVQGLGMGTPEQPNFKIHTNFFLTFQRVTR